MATTVTQLITTCNDWLAPVTMRDYCHNGLQVAGSDNIECLVSACSASLANIDQAIDLGAQALLVHHGIFWGKTERLVGPLRQRVARLLAADCNLIAYHLPLDAHLERGNNAVALRRLGIDQLAPFAHSQGQAIGCWGELSEGVTIEVLQQRCSALFQHDVIHAPGGPALVSRIGMVSGGGQSFLHDAHAIGCDVFISGEHSEQNWHDAAELGIHMLCCGHHASENIAIHQLGAELAANLGLCHVALPGDNPL